MRMLSAGARGLGPRWSGRLARAMAVLVFDVLRIRRQRIMSNLRLAFGPDRSDAELARIGRASVENFALTALEFLRSGHDGDIAANVELRGGEHMRAALAQGHGVYVLCFHLGNWEAMGAKVTRALAPAHVLVKKVGSGGMDRFVSETREKNGFLTVKRRSKGDGYRAIKEVLQRNEIVGFVMDQARPGEPKLPFFGHPAKTNTSLAAIWRRAPAPIVPGFIRRTGVDRHVLEFFPELTLETTEDAARDVETHTTQFNAVVEACVRKAPEQYFWMHNRWK
jgi:KDO2-lipid IV(A) lauroyltransferase